MPPMVIYPTELPIQPIATMKTTILLSLMLGLSAVAPLSAGAPLAPGPASDASSELRPFAPGLVVTEYPRHDSQANEKENFYVPLEKLGQPIGEKYIVESLDPWKWETERNAVASGFLEIEADGDYSFRTNSFYDRNLLMIQGEVVCGFRDGDDTVATIPLKKGGRVNILSAGFVGGRGSDGIHIRWKPPGQTELSPIPPRLLSHVDDGSVKPKQVAKKVSRPNNLLAAHLITVTDDFIVEAYKNGTRIQDGQRTLLNEIFGATAERINVDVRPGDWLVFHVVNNRLRWEGSKYFAVAGMLGENDFGFVSDPASEAWSVCDDPERVRDFIRHRDEGTEIRASPIAKPWGEGDDHMRQNAGAGFPGKALWGGGASTWIKFVAPKNHPKPVSLSVKETAPLEVITELESIPVKPAEPPAPPPAPKAMLTPTRWPVQILYGMYGSGDKNADVTLKLKEFIEQKKTWFAVTPSSLGIDPIPYWNKSLWIAYVKDGVRREVRRYENEHVLPESFYGPQDAPELTKWLPETRWRAEQGELQFHADHTATGYGFEGLPQWEALGHNKMRITWSDGRKVEYFFDYTWSSFREEGNAKATFNVMQ